MQHPAPGIAVDLRMAGDDIAELDAEDVTAAGYIRSCCSLKNLIVEIAR
jgi:hypothetical protein